jgi:hypothetical protein
MPAVATALSTFGPRTRRAIVFPTAAVAACLAQELTEAVRATAAVKGLALPTTPLDIAKAPFEVDSLVVVSILCAVEPMLGVELSEHVVRTGGYSSVQAAIDHLMPRIEAQWAAKNGSQI